MNEKWDRRMLALSQHIAQWSKDPSTKYGAVITDDLHRVVSVGYNGFPRNMLDTTELYQDREKKLSRVIHAEMNAILNSQMPLKGTTLYVTPFRPCDRCAVHIIQSGIKKVVTDNGCDPKWKDEFKWSEEYFNEAGVELQFYLMPHH